jgi:hypothetical protein
MPSGLKQDAHRERWMTTTADTKALVGRVAPLRPLTFRLPVSADRAGRDVVAIDVVSHSRLLSCAVRTR